VIADSERHSAGRLAELGCRNHGPAARRHTARAGAGRVREMLDCYTPRHTHAYTAMNWAANVVVTPDQIAGPRGMRGARVGLGASGPHADDVDKSENAGFTTAKPWLPLKQTGRRATSTMEEKKVHSILTLYHRCGCPALTSGFVDRQTFAIVGRGGADVLD